MILCPNCHHQELEGAIFCSECGAKLFQNPQGITRTISRSPSDYLSESDSPPEYNESEQTQPPGTKTISLQLVGYNKIISMAGRSEFTVGRTSEGQPILPDVDLTPYEAYSQGVSRLHASLKLVNQSLVITDLGSANGTRVNGQKIMPHIEYPLKHGDMVALGKFKIQILFHG
jgi:pSer/pThr/pTyr-binding forkhead associated (FHA) protein